ncbi:unnamed protein product [Rotaria socialis]|nr:unnamed protein product [Rotaria socialis]CAF4679842.1 unnamed protein product [Rotaria socialis]
MITAIIAIVFAARLLVIPMDTASTQGVRCQPLPDCYAYRRLHATITKFGYCYIPLTIVIIGNLLTIFTIKRAVIRRHDLLANNSNQQNRQMDSNESHLMLMLLILTLMFIVYFVPFTITNAISRLGLPFKHCFTQKSFEVYAVLRVLSEILKDSNFCYLLCKRSSVTFCIFLTSQCSSSTINHDFNQI